MRTARQSRAKVGSMSKETSASDPTALPPERLFINHVAADKTWWAEHHVPVRYSVGPKAGQIGWATAASWPLSSHDQASAYSDACHDVKINPETGLHPSGVKFDIIVNGEVRRA